jgi:hypothetical protein
MPELCRFYGIRITMYYDDHHPAHFHARYGGDEAVIAIETLDVIAGSLPRRALGLVYEWASSHRADLKRAWMQAQNLEPVESIDPLD